MSNWVKALIDPGVQFEVNGQHAYKELSNLIDKKDYYTKIKSKIKESPLKDIAEKLKLRKKRQIHNTQHHNQNKKEQSKPQEKEQKLIY